MTRRMLGRAVGAVAMRFRAFQEVYVLPWWGSGGLASLPLWALDTIVLVVKVFSACVVYIFNVVIPPVLKSLHGETVLITNAGHGLGRELALQLAELGAAVVCWDSDKTRVEALVRDVRAKEADCIGFTVDTTSREQISAAAQCLRKHAVDVTMVITSAGDAVSCAPLARLHNETATKLIEAHLLAHLWVIQTFLPGMIERRHGYIVAINSTASLIPCADMAPYCAAKYGLRGLMESIAEELRLDVWTRNIRAMTVYLTLAEDRRASDSRFAYWCRELDAAHAARAIINGIRRNKQTVCIPFYMKKLISIHDLMPYRIRIIFRDFFNFGQRSWFYCC